MIKLYEWFSCIQTEMSFLEKHSRFRGVSEVSQVQFILRPLSANPTKWLNTLKQFVVNLPTNYLSVFDHFVKLALKGLKK